LPNDAVIRPRLARLEGFFGAPIFPFWLHLLVPAVLMYFLYTPLLGNFVDFAKTKISVVRRPG